MNRLLLCVLMLGISACTSEGQWDKACDKTRVLGTCEYHREYRKDGLYLCPEAGSLCTSMTLRYRFSDRMDEDELSRDYHSTGMCIAVKMGNLGETLLPQNGCKAYAKRDNK